VCVNYENQSVKVYIMLKNSMKDVVLSQCFKQSSVMIPNSSQVRLLKVRLFGAIEHTIHRT